MKKSNRDKVLALAVARVVRDISIVSGMIVLAAGFLLIKVISG
jgi:hypothetical protein